MNEYFQKSLLDFEFKVKYENKIPKSEKIKSQ
jgi:hypothetical protein